MHVCVHIGIAETNRKDEYESLNEVAALIPVTESSIPGQSLKRTISLLKGKCVGSDVGGCFLFGL